MPAQSIWSWPAVGAFAGLTLARAQMRPHPAEPPFQPSAEDWFTFASAMIAVQSLIAVFFLWRTCPSGTRWLNAALSALCIWTVCFGGVCALVHAVPSCKAVFADVLGYWACAHQANAWFAKYVRSPVQLAAAAPAVSGGDAALLRDPDFPANAAFNGGGARVEAGGGPGAPSWAKETIARPPSSWAKETIARPPLPAPTPAPTPDLAPAAASAGLREAHRQRVKAHLSQLSPETMAHFQRTLLLMLKQDSVVFNQLDAHNFADAWTHLFVPLIDEPEHARARAELLALLRLKDWIGQTTWLLHGALAAAALTGARLAGVGCRA